MSLLCGTGRLWTGRGWLGFDFSAGKVVPPAGLELIVISLFYESIKFNILFCTPRYTPNLEWVCGRESQFEAHLHRLAP